MGIGGGIIAAGKAREARVEATVVRADGRVESLGLVSYWHVNPLRRWAVNGWIKLKRAFR